MPENIVVTLKTENHGGFWPFVRGTFAWIGFGVVVGVGVSIFDGPNPEVKPAQIIKAFGEGMRADDAAYHAKANPYGQAPSLDDAALVECLVSADCLFLLQALVLPAETTTLFVNPFGDAPALPGQSPLKKESNHVD